MTPNFKLHMFTASQKALHAGIDNSLGYSNEDKMVRQNLKQLATVLEQFHWLVAGITSGYRCPELNQMVGGHPNSLHTKGLAVDFFPPVEYTPQEAADCIDALGIPDLDIVVYKTHVHVEIDRS